MEFILTTANVNAQIFPRAQAWLTHKALLLSQGAMVGIIRDITEWVKRLERIYESHTSGRWRYGALAPALGDCFTITFLRPIS